MTAVLFAGLPGQESGHSLAAVLYGDVSPTGRLPYTVARRESDYGPLLNSTVPLPGDDQAFPEANFTEGLLIDYRRFDRHNITPRFEFGFGLSYTSFRYSALSVTLLPHNPPEEQLAEFPDRSVPVVQGGHPALWDVLALVRCTVTNTGRDVAGAEVAQLYVGLPAPAPGAGDEDTPVRQLRGFAKVGPLAPGEGREAVFELTRRDLSVWDVVAQQWRLRRGVYTVWVGASSRDLRLQGSLEIR